ncbi:hypothetical protein GCM10007036_10680 [Alsobacter metallidurans]|uniref:DUF1289 domain-containing protein n=1 Tax=Alsobacter metallidurans TaxID=340221 RepID=A0A917MG39_9HYPH|nr:DUF1289 domain-containing protein [Alsobacter metallidurans]GGH12652.1 hypothetical protein GCM10007036_10680 [Alsobacter metallidurans]
MPVPSPCIKVCALDPATGWCVGCGRSAREIAGWSRLDEDDQLAVLETLPSRRASLANIAPPPMDCATCGACSGRSAAAA